MEAGGSDKKGLSDEVATESKQRLDRTRMGMHTENLGTGGKVSGNRARL